MLTFDKLKIVTDIQSIKDINPYYFKQISQGDYVRGYRYSKKKPYTLIIETNNDKGELVIEFSAKVLIDKYPQMINKDTIRECFDNINRLGICTLDTDAIIQDSQVVKCDITRDAEGDVKEIREYIRQHLANYRKWNAKPYAGGIVVEKTATTDRKRFAIYDKEREMSRKTSAPFIELLANPQEVLDHFKGKVRFEINARSVSMIRLLLDIQRTDLNAVLNSTANPFAAIIDEALRVPATTDLTPKKMTLRDYERTLLLKECNYDLEAVSERLRSLISSSTSLTKTLANYRRLLPCSAHFSELDTIYIYKWLVSPTPTLPSREGVLNIVE